MSKKLLLGSITILSLRCQSFRLISAEDACVVMSLFAGGLSVQEGALCFVCWERTRKQHISIWVRWRAQTRQIVISRTPAFSWEWFTMHYVQSFVFSGERFSVSHLFNATQSAPTVHSTRTETFSGSRFALGNVSGCSGPKCHSWKQRNTLFYIAHPK